MPKIEANGIQIYYEFHGPTDGDVLVLSNGVLMSTASWAFQTNVFSHHYRLLLYDCRGMWQSDHPPGPYSMELHGEDLSCLLDALGIEQAHIGGTSYGAEISMVFALHFPERTKSLIVTSAVSHLSPVLKGMANSWIMAARAKDPNLLFQLVYPLTFSDHWISDNQAVLDEALLRYRKLDFDAFLNLMLSFSDLDITGELGKIKAPTLVIVGEEDILKPRRYSEIIANQIPNSTFAVIPGAGHAAMWEQPGIFNSLVIGFLSEYAENEKDIDGQGSG